MLHCGCFARFMGECLPGARPARYFSINYPDFSPRFTLPWRSPPSRPHCTAHLPYKARCKIKAGSVNSITPIVICSVINKQHWSHKCGCQYIHYNSAPYTYHKLRRWSAFGNTKHTLPPHPLPHLAWRPSCFGQSKPEAGHAPILGGPQQRGQNQKSKPKPGVTMMLLVSQSVGL